MQTIGRHGHERWEIRMNAVKAEELRAEAHRKCPRRPCVTDDDAIPHTETHNNEMGCFFCWKSKHCAVRFNPSLQSLMSLQSSVRQQTSASAVHAA